MHIIASVDQCRTVNAQFNGVKIKQINSIIDFTLWFIFLLINLLVGLLIAEEANPMDGRLTPVTLLFSFFILTFSLSERQDKYY